MVLFVDINVGVGREGLSRRFYVIRVGPSTAYTGWFSPDYRYSSFGYFSMEVEGEAVMMFLTIEGENPSGSAAQPAIYVYTPYRAYNADFFDLKVRVWCSRRYPYYRYYGWTHNNMGMSLLETPIRTVTNNYSSNYCILRRKQRREIGLEPRYSLMTIIPTQLSSLI